MSGFVCVCVCVCVQAEVSFIAPFHKVLHHRPMYTLITVKPTNYNCIVSKFKDVPVCMLTAAVVGVEDVQQRFRLRHSLSILTLSGLSVKKSSIQYTELKSIIKSIKGFCVEIFGRVY